MLDKDITDNILEEGLEHFLRNKETEVLINSKFNSIMKKWYYSWTVWFNIVVLVVAFLSQLAEIIPLSPAFLSGLGVVGNLILRLKTDTGIKF